MTRWSTHQLWALGPVLASTIAISDLLTGPRIVLIGLLVVGPAHVMMTGRRVWTALTAAWVAGPPSRWASTTTSGEPRRTWR